MYFVRMNEFAGQARLDTSVPQEDYLALQAEIDNLREDHLVALRREVEARVDSLKVCVCVHAIYVTQIL